MAYDAYTHYYDHSAVLERLYPYTAVNGTCVEDEATPTGWKTTGYFTVSYDDVNQMKEALSHQPLNLSIQANATSFRSYTSGILNDPACGNVHNHAVLLVGWGID
jgi:cathepsin L